MVRDELGVLSAFLACCRRPGSTGSSRGRFVQCPSAVGIVLQQIVGALMEID